MRRAALWLWVCALALRLQPALAQVVATNVPPEDQDSSGDDSDSFSGSGAGALQDIPSSASPWKDTWLLSVGPTAPEPSGGEATAISTPILPAGGRPEEGEVSVVLETRPDITAREKEVNPEPREPTQLPTTQRASAAGATTAQVTATSHPPGDVHPSQAETAAPAVPSQPDGEDAGPSATEGATEDGAHHELPVEEGSGEQDFTFDTSGENVSVASVEPEDRSDTAVDQGASQGLLDRKEVLGGVIAGGLVGLLFAVFLVGFMLYRMKKKDEGSYSLEEPKQANGGAYQKPTKQEEFYA
ncbi:syndecan-1 isoform X2 [Cavia porcellus]|uniref:syndecan-1 isoform X2 n=1 Tax=Cavia porcellus TaxID=10141 RepID=UPI002FE2A490